MKRLDTVAALADFGRTRLSASFFMRDFLFSDVATIHGLANVPDDPTLAIAAGTRLCEDLLEPIQLRFGRIAIRSAFRSAEVNALCNARQRSGARGYGCASNEKNFASHIWDRRDAANRMGATACIVVPAFHDAFGREEGGWRRMAWWIHDHLPYSSLEFFPTLFAFNVQWREEPERRIDSYAIPKGCLTRPGLADHSGRHDAEWQGIDALFGHSSKPIPDID
jgi:hypothetical protein